MVCCCNFKTTILLCRISYFNGYVVFREFYVSRFNVRDVHNDFKDALPCIPYEEVVGLWTDAYYKDGNIVNGVYNKIAIDAFVENQYPITILNFKNCYDNLVTIFPNIRFVKTYDNAPISEGYDVFLDLGKNCCEES